MLFRIPTGRAASRAVICVGFALGALIASMPLAGAAGASSLSQEKGHLLKLSDMPKGWKTEPGTGGSNGSSNFPGAAQLASCLGVSSRLINANPPEIYSPYFQNQAGSLEVQDSITVFPSVSNAKAEYSVIANSKTPSCLGTIMNSASVKSELASSTGEGAVIGTIAVTKAGVPNFGRGTSAIEMSIPITYQGTNVRAQLIEVTFIKGKLGRQLSFNSYSRTFPTSLSKHLVALAQSRL